MKGEHAERTVNGLTSSKTIRKSNKSDIEEENQNVEKLELSVDSKRLETVERKLAELEESTFQSRGRLRFGGESTGSRSRERHFEKKAPKGSH